MSIKTSWEIFERTTLKLGRFIAFVVRRFFANDGSYRAAALTFTSLLAIVPLMSVSFTVLSAFPVFHSAYKPIQDFIFSHFVPATGQVVQQYLQGFVAQASQLSLWGVVFLITTALLVMFTIEQSLNLIWRVRTQRKGIAAFTLYWAVLTLAPVLMGLSLVVSSYLTSLPLLQGTVMSTEMAKAQIIQWLPFSLTVVTFTFLYVAVPNCKVKIRHGFAGAVFAAALFESARVGFTYYLQQYPTYQLLYGAFATVPIFFLWVYWVWVIVLLGAEVAHALSAHYDRRLGKRLDPFTHSLRWLGHLWRAQLTTEGLTLQQLINRDPYNYVIDPDEQIATLVNSQLVTLSGRGHYVLLRDLSSLSLHELYRALPWQLPTAEEVSQYTEIQEKALAKVLQQVDHNNKTTMKMPFTDLIARQKAHVESLPNANDKPQAS
jgi:membrane protein